MFLLGKNPAPGGSTIALEDVEGEEDEEEEEEEEERSRGEGGAMEWGECHESTPWGASFDIM